MQEHRLIERIIPIIKIQIDRIEVNHSADITTIDTIVDFFRTYADQTHHGKEEEILFRDLAKKPLLPEYSRIMRELIEEHVYARSLVEQVIESKETFLAGNNQGLTMMKTSLTKIANFYPDHIKKEDTHFFIPVIAYFSEDEQSAMLRDFYDFDRRMIHEKYAKVLESLEKTAQSQPGSNSYQSSGKGLYVCNVCGYIYDPAVGDPDHGIKTGTQFDQLPEGWRCPICDAPKSEFSKVE